MHCTVERLLQRSVDGLVFLSPGVTPDQLAETVAQKPTIVIDGASNDTGAVISVERHGARLATRHLLDLGHEQIGHITGPTLTWTSQERAAGCHDEISRNGSDLSSLSIAEDSTSRSTYLATKELILTKGVTAIVAADDDVAVAVMAAVRDLGRRIPSDVSIIGIGDHPHSKYLDPELTTVSQDYENAGRSALLAMEHQLDRRGGVSDVGRLAVALPTLIVRNSTARLHAQPHVLHTGLPRPPHTSIDTSAVSTRRQILN